jgi:hypothetical protein
MRKKYLTTAIKGEKYFPSALVIVLTIAIKH